MVANIPLVQEFTANTFFTFKYSETFFKNLSNFPDVSQPLFLLF